ncbi:YggU family protein, partial [archaeon]|nr:YggU family protein [archaeon]
TTNAKSTGIKGFDMWRERILVGVKEPPSQNRANREIMSFFSKLLNCDVKIVSGAKSGQKTIMASCREEDARRALYEGK